jgi:MSHA biogenesis protein MshI
VQLLQKFLKKPIESRGIVAISFLDNGFSIAVTRYNEQNRPRLLHCEFVTASTQQLPPQLELLVKQHSLDQYDCHILLTQEQYRTISIEAPAVQSEEMKDALRWRIADYLDYPTDQATIDFYPHPRSNRANTTNSLEVVACNNGVITSLAQQAKHAGLNVKVIDIQETALRNLASLLPENEQGVALIHLQKNGGLIVIQKNGEIYLTRKITSGYLQLSDSQTEDEIEQDNLALEIQRSFDYVENYFDIPPITSLASVLMPIDTQKIINFLNASHGITARAMDISAIVDGETLLNDAAQNICAPVIGASLRRLLESRLS